MNVCLSQNELHRILVSVEDVNENYISKIGTALVKNFSAKIQEELIGLDQAYLVFLIENATVTLEWDSMAGLSIVCYRSDIRTNIFQYLQSI